MVVYIRELRHMLPFTILVIPLAIADLERNIGASGFSRIVTDKG
jgi:hypothetical protein